MLVQVSMLAEFGLICGGGVATGTCPMPPMLMGCMLTAVKSGIWGPGPRCIVGMAMAGERGEGHGLAGGEGGGGGE